MIGLHCRGGSYPFRARVGAFPERGKRTGPFFSMTRVCDLYSARQAAENNVFKLT